MFGSTSSGSGAPQQGACLAYQVLRDPVSQLSRKSDSKRMYKAEKVRKDCIERWFSRF